MAPLDTAAIAKIVGHAGDTTGAVYKITVGRDDIVLKEMGATINARMGLNTWVAFFGTNDNVAIAGDVAMLTSEVAPVLKALRQHGLQVVAIHHHMTGTQPTIFFLHHRGTGPADRRRPAVGQMSAIVQLEGDATGGPITNWTPEAKKWHRAGLPLSSRPAFS